MWTAGFPQVNANQDRRQWLLAAALWAPAALTGCANLPSSPKSAPENRWTDDFIRVYASRDAAATLAMLAEDVYFEDVTSHFIARNRDEMRQFIEPVPHMYQSLQVQPINRLIAGPWVIAQQRILGVMNHNDGRPRPIDVQGLSMFLWRDGRISKWYDYYDVLGFQQQAR